MRATQHNAPHAPQGTGMAVFAGAFFALRIAIVLLCARVLGLEPRTGAILTIVAGIVLLALVCFHSLGASDTTGAPTLPTRALLRLPAMRWVLLFLLVSGLSFAWTGSVAPSASFVYWCALIVDVATVLLLLRGNSSTETAQAVMRGFLYGSCAIAILAWMMPIQSDLRLGDPDYLNTNQIGNLCAFALFFAQYLERSSSHKWTLAKTLLLLTLVRSLSKTTLVAFFLSQSYLLLRDKSISHRKKISLTLGALVLALAFWSLFAAYFDVYTNAGNQSETLTGRTGIWALALESALTKPWLGNGFDAMWKVIPPLGIDRFEPRHAENELLQQFYAYGVAGIVLLAGIYSALFRHFRRISERPQRILLISLMLFILVRGLAEAEPFDLLLPLWSIALFSVLAARPNNALEPAPHALQPANPAIVTSM